MSNHVTEWLSAYLDGELRGSRLLQVETHLAACEVCQAELESLEKLSGLLAEVPVPEFTSPERFASQVGLRLPHVKRGIARKRILEIGWWMIPVGLVAAWVLISTAFWASDLASIMNRFGLLNSVSGWVQLVAPNRASLSLTLAQVGLLHGNALDVAASFERLARITLREIGFQASIALLYLSWIAIWWAHRQKRNGPLLES